MKQFFPSLPSTSSLVTLSPTENLLTHHAWYWGDVQKDVVSAAMENQRDGSFMVRDASTKGDFTLTLRIASANKLIKIFVCNGKYGFTMDTLDFNSLPELIFFYRKHSLKDFNEKLDTCLLYPLTNPYSIKPIKFVRSNSLKSTMQMINCRLEGVHAEYERVSRRYDQIFLQKASLLEECQKKRGTLTAYIDALQIFKEKNDTLKKALNNLLEIKQKDMLKINLDLQFSRIENIEKAKSLMSTTLSNIEKAIQNIDDELEELKPRLLTLHRTRDNCKELIISKSNGNNQIDEMLQEISFILDFEPVNLTHFLLKTEMKWDPEEWLISDGNKENAVKLINAAVTNIRLGETSTTDGIFLIRPSQSQAGYFALTITKDTVVHSCLIEYREPRKSDYCGYAFLNTNMFFSTLVDFVRYYSKISLIEHNSQLDTCLKIPALSLFK